MVIGSVVCVVSSNSGGSGENWMWVGVVDIGYGCYGMLNIRWVG